MIHSPIHSLVYLLTPVIHSATIYEMNETVSHALGGARRGSGNWRSSPCLMGWGLQPPVALQRETCRISSGIVPPISIHVPMIRCLCQAHFRIPFNKARS